MLFKEIIAVCSENHTNPINTKYSDTAGAHNYHWNLERV
jgi:hypothetical protein